MNSIFAQTLTDWELIVCDSFSGDGTWAYLQQFKDDPRVHLYQVPKEGLYAGWNECLRRCRGDYIYIAPADDTCKPELLEKMVRLLGNVESRKLKVEIDSTNNEEPRTKNQERPIDIAVCDFDFIDENGCIIDPPPRGTARTFYGDWLQTPHFRSGLLEYLVHSFVDISWTTMTAVLFRRRLLERTGLFRTDCGPYADLFWAQRAGLFSDAVYLPDRLATWRYHSSQHSRGDGEPEKQRKALWRIAQEELDACTDAIPAEWKQANDWKQILLWGARRRYLTGYGLNRHELRAHPGHFFKGCVDALLNDPTFFCRRILRGFDWKDELLSEPETHLRQFMHTYEVPEPTVLAGFNLK